MVDFTAPDRKNVLLVPKRVTDETIDVDKNETAPIGRRAVRERQRQLLQARANNNVDSEIAAPIGRRAVRDSQRARSDNVTGLGTQETSPNDQSIRNAEARVQDGTNTGSLSSKDKAAAAQARGDVTTGEGIKIEANVDNLQVPENVLLEYVNLQYHIVLSLVPETKVVNIQKRIPVGAEPRNVGSFDALQQSIEQEGAIPFASTGDVFQAEIDEVTGEQVSRFTGEIEGEFDAFGDFARGEIIANVGGRNYYNIESLTFDTVMGPTPQNMFLNSMLLGKIVLVEPHGFKFKEDVVRLGNKIGYKELNPGRYMWRIDIFFSGYNQDTGEWVPFIELNARTQQTKLLTYYVNFTTVEAKLDHTGTTYDISFAPSGHVAYRPEEIIINAGAIFTGNRARAETFGGFLERIAESMEDAVAERTHQQVKRKYEFKAPPELLAAPFFTGNFEFKKGYLGNDPKKGSFVTAPRDVNVIGIVEEALQDIAFVWNEFLKIDDKQHVKPRIHWGMRFNVVFDSGPNPGTGDYDTITIQYIIDPFVTFKKTRLNNREDMVKVVDAAAQNRRIREMLRFGMINRVYNYINTSENLEVIELDIALKNFYYHTMYKPSPHQGTSGNQQSESAGPKLNKIINVNQQAKETGTNSDQDGDTVPRQQENSVDSALKRLFGREIDNPSAECDTELLKTPWDKYGGGFGEMPTTDHRSMVGATDIPERAEYQANLNDHVKNDLLTIQLQVRGDPIWLLNPYGVYSGNVLSSPSLTNEIEGPTALVVPQSARCFFLRMFAPVQSDLMDPDRMDASTACSVVGGFYEVTTVASKFEGGKFTQTINAYKMNHLNYVESFVAIVPEEDSPGESRAADPEVSQRNSQPDQAVQE